MFERLGNHSHPQSITRRLGEKAEVLSLPDIREAQNASIKSLHSSLHEMHKDVSVRSTNKRGAAVASHNYKTNVRPINFSEGDFVLRSLLQR